MPDELLTPVFDEIIELIDDDLDSDVTALVIHRNAEGRVFCCHSPLDEGPVHCTLCEEVGVKVYI